MTVREPLLVDRRVGRTAPRATKDEVNSADAMAPRLLSPLLSACCRCTAREIC